MGENSYLPIREYSQWKSYLKYIKLPTDIQMAYMEAGNTNGEPLVMLHGFSDSSMAWRCMMPYLEKDFHIFALDVRGHGATDKPVQFAYTALQHAADVIAFAKLLEIEGFFIVGHSMGSMIAQAVAYSEPEMVKGVFLISAAARFRDTPDMLDKQKKLFEEFSKKKPEIIEWTPNYAAYAEPESAVALNALTNVWPEYCWKAAWYGMEFSDNTRFLQYITAPVMVVWGGKDELFDKSYRDEFMKYLPYAEYKIYDDNTHELNQEIPREIANEIKGFFNKKMV